MSIVNCTPHPIDVFKKLDEDDWKFMVRIPPSGFVMRLDSHEQECRGAWGATGVDGELVRIPVVTSQRFKTEIKWPTSEEIPELSDENAVILVSMPVGQFIAELNEDIPYNVGGPDTGPEGVVRDSEGQILGTTRFVWYRAKGTSVGRT